MVLVIIFIDVVLPSLGGLGEEGGEHESWHRDHQVHLGAGLQLYPVLRISFHQPHVEDSVPSHLAVRVLDGAHWRLTVGPRILGAIDGAGVSVELAAMVEPEALLVEVPAAELELLLVDGVRDSKRPLSRRNFDELAVLEVFIPLLLDGGIVDLLADVRQKAYLRSLLSSPF